MTIILLTSTYFRGLDEIGRTTEDLKISRETLRSVPEIVPADVQTAGDKA